MTNEKQLQEHSNLKNQEKKETSAERAIVDQKVKLIKELD